MASRTCLSPPDIARGGVHTHARPPDPHLYDGCRRIILHGKVAFYDAARQRLLDGGGWASAQKARRSNGFRSIDTPLGYSRLPAGLPPGRYRMVLARSRLAPAPLIATGREVITCFQPSDSQPTSRAHLSFNRSLSTTKERVTSSQVLETPARKELPSSTREVIMCRDSTSRQDHAPFVRSSRAAGRPVIYQDGPRGKGTRPRGLEGCEREHHPHPGRDSSSTTSTTTNALRNRILQLRLDSSSCRGEPRLDDCKVRGNVLARQCLPDERGVQVDFAPRTSRPLSQRVPDINNHALCVPPSSECNDDVT